MSTAAQRRQWEQQDRMPDGYFVSMRDYLQAKIDALELRTNQRFDGEQRARELAATRLESRLESMNEIRAQLATQRAEFATNEKFDAWGASMAQRIEILMKADELTASTLRDASQRDLDAIRSRMDRDQQRMNDDIRSLRESRSAAVGSTTASREWLTGLLAITAIVSGIIGHFIH